MRTYRPLHSYATHRPATAVDISDRGMLAVGCGPTVQVYADCLARRAAAPYMTHRLPGCAAEGLRFAPFEDVLGVGHSKGFCSMLVPGAGEPNFDAFEANPFETRSQRREGAVVALLEKLPPTSIMLDPSKINVVDRAPKERQREAQAEHAARQAELSAARKKKKEGKRKTRGRSKASKRAAKKQANIIDEKRVRRSEQLALEEKQRKSKKAAAARAAADAAPRDALSRFNAPGAQPAG